MIQEVKVPSVGESVSEGLLSHWNVKDGQYVNAGETLFELETDKASTEVPSPESGVIQLLVEEGTELQIGAVVAKIDTEGKAAKAPQKEGNGAQTEAKASKKEKPAEAKGEQTEAETPPQKKNSTPDMHEPVPKELAEPEEEGIEDPRIHVTSVARKIAEEHGVPLADIEGSGPHGRITRGDVEAHVARRPSPSDKVEPRDASHPSHPVPSTIMHDEPSPAETDQNVKRERMSMLRRRIAERLLEAKHGTAMLTTFNDVDMSAVLELRSQFKEPFKDRYGVGLGFMSFFTRASALALMDFPRVNSMIDGKDMVTFKRAHIGVAVSTEKGLVVPVLRDAASKSFAEIEAEIRDFATRAREERLEISEMRGGTFTITNGGVFGSLLSTPILNPPQSAILGMHRIEDRPVARNGEVVIRPMMYLALSYDHRIVDGAEAVGFLTRIKEFIENPARMLLDV